MNLPIGFQDHAIISRGAVKLLIYASKPETMSLLANIEHVIRDFILSMSFFLVISGWDWFDTLCRFPSPKLTYSY